MTEYAGFGWTSKSAKRKAIRDGARKRFEGQVSSAPHHDAGEAAFAPRKQRVTVTRLMQVTRDLVSDDEHKRMLVEMAKVIASVGLGKGAMGDIAEHVSSVHLNHSKRLKDFFLLPYQYDGED